MRSHTSTPVTQHYLQAHPLHSGLIFFPGPQAPEPVASHWTLIPGPQFLPYLPASTACSPGSEALGLEKP